MKCNLTLYFALLLAIAGTTSAQCEPGWTLVSNKCMMCGSSKKVFDDARVDCDGRGGNLASVVNNAQETFAEGCDFPLDAADGVWLGLVARGTAPLFVWQDGSAYAIPGSFPTAVTVPAVTNTAINCFFISTTDTWTQEGTGCGTGDTDRYYVCNKDPAMCPALVAPHGANLVYAPATTPHYPGTVATYSCQAGYELEGESTTRTCQPPPPGAPFDGTWDGDAPTCVPKSCGPLPAPANGRVDARVTTFNSVATYSCNDGYTLGNASPTRICDNTASWTGAAPTCSAVDCGVPSKPENGDVTVSATTHGSAATYACNRNYQMRGDASSTCMENGAWSGSVPVCDNTLALGLGIGLGGLALLAILSVVLYCLCRNPGPVARVLPPAIRAPYPRRPGPVVRPPPQPRRLY